jgi:hypothetical protein
MGDMMVLDITTEIGQNITVVNLHHQQEIGRNIAMQPAQMVNWNNILNDKIIVFMDFNSHSQRWDPNGRCERDATFERDCSTNILMHLDNDRQCRLERNNSSKFGIDLTWSLLLEFPLMYWRLAKVHEEPGSDHGVIIW